MTKPAGGTSEPSRAPSARSYSRTDVGSSAYAAARGRRREAPGRVPIAPRPRAPPPAAAPGDAATSRGQRTAPTRTAGRPRPRSRCRAGSPAPGGRRAAAPARSPTDAPVRHRPVRATPTSQAPSARRTVAASPAPSSSTSRSPSSSRSTRLTWWAIDSGSGTGRRAWHPARRRTDAASRAQHQQRDPLAVDPVLGALPGRRPPAPPPPRPRARR